MNTPGFGAGRVDRGLTGFQIVGQLVALGDVLTVAERHVADQLNLVFELVINRVVAGRDLGLGNHRHGSCRLEPREARAG